MANTARMSNQVYMTLRGREVPRREMDYTDAASAMWSPRGDAAGWGVERPAYGQMAFEEQDADIGMKAGAAEYNEEEFQPTYQDYVRQTHAMLSSVEKMFKTVGENFLKLHNEQGGWLSQLTNYTISREKAMDKMIALCARNSRTRSARAKEPMPFSGANPREWLLQMRQYYDMEGLEEEERLKDAPFHLRGDAHLYYYTLAQRNPERLPKTWTQFENLITQRFSSRSPVETMQRLRQIRYRDSVSDVTSEFARICAEGEPIPEDKLIYIYLGRFPKAMVDEALKQDFSTWVEASDYLMTQNSKHNMRLAAWYEEASPELRREVEMDKQCMREGWIPKTPANYSSKLPASVKPGLGGQGAGANKVGPGAARSTLGQEKASFNKFLESLVCHACQGRGHRVKECPSRDVATRRDDSKCRKCGGMGHWARACPSQGPTWTHRQGAQQTQQAALEMGAGRTGNGQA